MERAAELDREAAKASSSSAVSAGAGVAGAASSAAVAGAAAATLRRLVFNLLTLVDHHLVPELQARPHKPHAFDP